jgi:hypothetical protein
MLPILLLLGLVYAHCVTAQDVQVTAVGDEFNIAEQSLLELAKTSPKEHVTVCSHHPASLIAPTRRRASVDFRARF